MVAIIDVLRYYTLAIIGIIIILFLRGGDNIDSVRNSLPLRLSGIFSKEYVCNLSIQEMFLPNDTYR